MAEASGKEFEEVLLKLSRHQDPLVQQALALRKQVEEGNAQDLGFLCKRLRGSLPPGKCLMDDRDFRDKLVEKLKADKGKYAETLEALKKARKSGGDGGSEELRSSLGKLVGTEAHPGIMDNAVSLLSAEDARRKGILDKDPKEMDPRYNEVTVLKTLLLYSYLVAKGQDHLTLEEGKEFDSKVQLRYPAKVPKHAQSLADCTGLACKTEDGGLQLGILNAGYVWGGDLVDGKCRGMDCSAFLSRYTGAGRLATIHFEFIWRQQIAPEGFNEKEKAVLADFMKDRGFKKALEQYKAVVLGPEAGPQARDLVTWRGGGWGESDDPYARHGHVTMYLAPVGDSGNKFYGIDANRSDDTSFEKANQVKDKSFEGFLISIKELRAKDRKTYVLRPL